jgi:hypothetical protein
LKRSDSKYLSVMAQSVELPFSPEMDSATAMKLRENGIRFVVAKMEDTQRVW